MRRSAASHSSRAVARSPASAAMRASASRAKTSTGASSSSRACVEDRDEPLLCAGTRSSASSAASRHSPSAACSPPPAARCHAVAASSAARAVCDPSERTQDTPEMDAGERRQPHVAGRLGLLDRELQRGGARLVVTGLALRTPEAGELVRLRLQEAEPSRRLRRTTDVEDGIVEPMLDAGQFAEHRVAANVEPRVVDHAQPMLHLIARLDGARAITGRDRCPGGEEPVRGLIPRAVQPAVERAAAIGQLQRLTELAVDATRRTRGSSSSAPAGRHRRSRRPARWLRRCVRGRARGDPSTLRSTRRAAARRPDRGIGAASPAASSAARIRCAPRLSPRTTQAQPNPLTMSSASSGSWVALQARAASMLARSARANERCSA